MDLLCLIRSTSRNRRSSAVRFWGGEVACELVGTLEASSSDDNAVGETEQAETDP